MRYLFLYAYVAFHLTETKNPRIDILGSPRGMTRFELDRTASNLIELEHPKKRGKRSPKPYELRGMVEVDRT